MIGRRQEGVEQNINQPNPTPSKNEDPKIRATTQHKERSARASQHTSDKQHVDSIIMKEFEAMSVLVSREDGDDEDRSKMKEDKSWTGNVSMIREIIKVCWPRSGPRNRVLPERN